MVKKERQTSDKSSQVKSERDEYMDFPMRLFLKASSETTKISSKRARGAKKVLVDIRPNKNFPLSRERVKLYLSEDRHALMRIIAIRHGMTVDAFYRRLHHHFFEIVLSKSRHETAIQDLEAKLELRAEGFRIAREKATKLIHTKPEKLYFQGELDGRFQFISSEPLPPLGKKDTRKFRITFYLWGGTFLTDFIHHSTRH